MRKIDIVEYYRRIDGADLRKCLCGWKKGSGNRSRAWSRVPAVCVISLADSEEKFGLRLKNLPEDEIEEIAMKYIRMVDLEKFTNAYPKELSGGMKQRVAIARAYAVNPEVLLMDEPFGALDAQTRTQLQSELLKTWQEERKTCFFITHDVEEAIILAQRVVIMSARPGRIKEIVEIDIPYPRTQETRMDPTFIELKNFIWSRVYQEYLEIPK